MNTNVALLCDLIHSEGAEIKAVYGSDFYQGMPALTVNKFGTGQAWYVATSPEPSFLQGFLANLCKEKGITAPITPVPGVEISQRTNESETYLFILNHNDQPVNVDLGTLKGMDLIIGQPVTNTVTLSTKGVLILSIS